MKLARIPMDLRISLIYVFIGGMWILFSDKLLTAFIIDIPTLTKISIYKGWFYVTITGILLYLLLKRDLTLHRHDAEKIRKSEERYRYLFDSNPFPMWIYDLETLRFLAVNDMAVAKYGYSRDEFLNMTLADIRPQKEVQQLLENIAQPRQTFEYSEGWQHRLKDGSLIDVAISSHTLQLEGHNAVLVIPQDVTVRKQAEEALRQSEELFSKAFQASPAGLVISTQAEGRIIEVNDSYCKLTGYSREELIGKNALDLNLWVDPVERPRVIQLLQDYGYVRNVEIKSRTHTDDVRIFLDSLDPIELRGEECIVSFILDVTERKHAEEKLRSTTLMLTSLLENMQSGILFEDQNRCTQLVNRTFCELFSITEASHSLIGRDSRTITESVISALKDGEAFKQGIETNISRTHIVLGEEIHLADGRVLERDYIPIDSGDQLTGHLWKYRDITDQKRNEDKIKDLARFPGESPSPIIRVSYDGLVIYANEASKDLLNLWQTNVGSYLPKNWQAFISDRIRLGKREELEIPSNGIIYSILFVPLPEEKYVNLYGRDITAYKKVERALRSAEEKYHTIFESAIEGIFQSTLDGHLLTANPALADMWGYDSPQDLTDSINDLSRQVYVDPKRRQEFLDRMEREGELHGFEYQVYRKDGAIIWVSENSRAVRDTNRVILYFEGNIQDVTERKRMETELREREARYRGLFEDSPISLWEEDFSAVKQRLDSLRANGVANFEEYFQVHPEVVAEYAALVKILDVNTATLHLLHAASKRELTENLVNVFGNESFSEFADELIWIAEGRHSFEWEGKNKTLDGELRDVYLNWSVVPGHEADLDKVIVSIIDVTERKQAEKALRESETRLSTIFRTSPLPIAISHPTDNRYTDANEAFFRLTGYSRTEVIGHTPYEIDLWVNLERREDLIRELHEKGSVQDFEFQIRQKSGDIRDMQMTAEFIELAGEQSILTIAQDITERKRAEEKIQQQLQRITALRDIDRTISSSLDLNLTLNRLLVQVNEQLRLDAAALLLFNPHTCLLQYFTTRGLRANDFHNVQVQLGEEYAGQVALERRMIRIDLQNSQTSHSGKNPFLRDGFVEYYGLPLIAKGQMRGVLEIFHRTHIDPDYEWLDYLETLAGQAAIAIDNVQLFDRLQKTNLELSLAYDATIEGWSHALDLRDKETEGHTQRVTAMTVELARAFDFTQKELMNIRWGALLHDIGKMGVPDSILLKPDKLTDEEWTSMKRHPALAHEMLSRIHYLRDALDIPRYHHEKWDGTGYPHGLKGEQIPLAARIFAIADVWDAIRSDRPYRPAWTTAKALKHIRELSGTYLDPKVVEVFMESKIYKK